MLSKLLHYTMIDGPSRALIQSTGYYLDQNEATICNLHIARLNLRIAAAKNAFNDKKDVDTSRAEQVQSKQKQKTVTRDALQSIQGEVQHLH